MRTKTRKFKPKICDSKTCGRLYTPTSGRGRYCTDCSETKRKERRAARARETYQRIQGLTCKWCPATDSTDAFKSIDECNNCAARGGRNGRCTHCAGRPLEKLLDRHMPSCDGCGLDGAGDGFIQVMLWSNGDIKTVFQSGSLQIRCGDGKKPLREVHRLVGLDNLVEMVVEEEMFERGWVSKPTTIRLESGWIRPDCFCSWPGVEALSDLSVLPRNRMTSVRTTDERLLTQDFLDTLYDICHFVVNTREADPMTFDWWRLNFRAKKTETDEGNVIVSENSHQTDIRYWERFKQRLRALGISFFLVDPVTHEPMRDRAISTHTCAIKFKKRALKNFVDKHLPADEDFEDSDDDIALIA